MTPEQITQVWSQWTEAYFLRYTPEEIAWQTTRTGRSRSLR